ncbi:protein BREAST CANCER SUSCEPTIBILITY 1 homolog isoform X1 [Lycium barbarum]|uniref:protein BREAST CANCER SUSCEPTIBILITY 1 homolog isoform X1 n=1 Tax=Lycium barbarum TaxID=112863 RepID=UPI00293E2C75|nr:protein BREAST CANCER SUSCEPTIBILITY 1 homolog isoform X1 [Lycium barbarum]
MADISHLEKMGRELKCPICLSLLNSAVSLTCNHVFCNSCIQTTMKSGANCPVCKVPFNRREIRPALHMDNLVSIYKNMEVASGVNIFVTQTNPSSKLPGEEIQSNGKQTCESQEKPRTITEAPVTDSQKRKRGKGSKKSSECNKKNTGSNLVRPSFLTKKRVQVPQYPPSETLPPTKLVGGNSKSITNEAQKPLVTEKDRSVLNGKGEPVLSPFFWLREEEDVERSTQQTDGDFIMDTPPDAPCFSDIKDSDDGVPCEMSTKSGAHNAANGADLFDSEMFEWTQRACSPELCSSPFKMKTKDTIESAGAQGQEKGEAYSLENANKESATQNRIAVASEKGTDKGQLSSHSLFPSENEITSSKGVVCKSSRSKALKSTKKKQGKKVLGEVSEVHNNSQIAVEHTLKNNQDNANAFNSKKKKLKNKKGSSTTKVTESVVEDISASCGAKSRKRNNSISFHLSTPVDQEKCEGSVETFDVKICHKRRRESLSEENKYCFRPKSRVRTGKYNNTQAHDEASHFESANRLVPIDNDGEATPGTEMNKCEPECDAKLLGKKKVKFSEDGQHADKENITLEKIQKRVLKSLETEKSVLNLNDLVLRKCEASHNKIQCAFCRSSEESEVSGVMLSYLNGKPVKGDADGVSGVINVHKHCAEWAPNVYFEDDDAVNLESELKRSRRITCFFCGVKGAALGCYETSCRKSFHVPCAKLTPECRWDYDNFVMLCPLHVDSKLPCEVPGKLSKIRESIKRNSSICQPKVSATPDNAAALQWKSQKKNKNLVLCCSALTADEIGLVSTLKRLSGVTIVKNWDLSVTHVIASTDEKGACRRTLKYLMGVLAGKWILSTDWIIACVEATEFIDEQQYEIKIDTHGIVDGPKLGRMRVLTKQPKLFNGYKFFFMGDFLPSYKSYLHDLVIAAGGIVLNRKPVAVDQEILSPGFPPPFVIYSHEQLDKCDGSKKNSILERRRSDAEALASSTGAVAASNSWILNCIAGSKLLELE